MEGMYDFELTSLGYEAKNILVDDSDETYNLKGRLVIQFSSLKEPKVFPCMREVVYNEIRPPEGEITMCECTPMVGDSLDQLINLNYPSQFNYFQFEYDDEGKIICFQINHGLGELTQLLILGDLCLEFKPRLSKFYFFEYKEK